MMRALLLLLALLLIGIPLGMAPTSTTAGFAAMAGLLVLGGLLSRSAALLVAAVSVSLVEALVAFLSVGTPPGLFSAVALGVVLYLVLDVGAFTSDFHGVSIDTSVWRMQARHWGWMSALSGLAGLSVGLLAGALAQPRANPLLLQGLAVASAGLAVGTVIGALSGWQGHRRS